MLCFVSFFSLFPMLYLLFSVKKLVFSRNQKLIRTFLLYWSNFEVSLDVWFCSFPIDKVLINSTFDELILV